ncbi:MAG: hypothetical protein M3R38_12310 [Actinomycetota bacterium]|nr:hypothetical protein [Actinomycetota bacterium]MDP9487329.1 hypothetical protein [Actinomycetota bacterium]
MRRRSEREESGNALVAVLLGLLLGAIVYALWAVGAGHYSEALAWGIVCLVLCQWLDRSEG